MYSALYLIIIKVGGHIVALCLRLRLPIAILDDVRVCGGGHTLPDSNWGKALHFVSKNCRGGGRTIRHNKIAYALISIFCECSVYDYVSRKEPGHLPGMPPLQRADILMRNSSQTYVVDAVCTCPVTENGVTSGVDPNASTARAQAARHAEERKRIKYAALINNPQYTFLPAAIECFGTMGPELYGFLKNLAHEQAHHEATTRLSAANSFLVLHDQMTLQEHEERAAMGKLKRWCRMISCALHAGNGHIIAMGRERASGRDERRETAMNDAYEWRDLNGGFYDE